MAWRFGWVDRIWGETCKELCKRIVSDVLEFRQDGEYKEFEKEVFFTQI